MSVRPNIYGFDLSRYQGLFASGDPAAIEACSARLEMFAEDIDPEEPEEAEEYLEEARAILTRAIRDGIPFPELETEGNIHMDVASAISEYQQSLFSTGSNGWKMQAFWRFEKDPGERLGADARRSLGYLARGRPLFGRQAEADGHYAYLDSGELDQFLGALRLLQQERAELTGPGYLDGFVGVLTGWLEAVASRGQDLWLLAH
jgi:hypothetical protein